MSNSSKSRKILKIIKRLSSADSPQSSKKTSEIFELLILDPFIVKSLLDHLEKSLFIALNNTSDKLSDLWR